MIVLKALAFVAVLSTAIAFNFAAMSVEPTVSQEAALLQMHDTDAGAIAWRSYDQIKRAATLMDCAVPLAFVVLFGKDIYRAGTRIAKRIEDRCEV